MDDRIEEQWPLHIKIYLTIMFAGLEIWILDIIIKLFKSGISSGTVGDMYVLILGIIFNVVFLGSPYKIIIEGEFVTIKRLLRKPVIIPLTSIIITGPWGASPSDKNYYIIKYNNKKLHLITLSYRFGNSFSAFMDELQRRIEKDKKAK